MYLPLALAVSILLLRAAWCDIVSRTIPDALPLLLVAVGALSRLVESVSSIVASCGVASLLFCLLLIAHSRGLLGGGDVKLITALTIGLSPFDTCRFVIATALAGGVLSGLYVLLSFVPYITSQARRKSLLGRILAIEAWRMRKRGPLPYGVAIAAGGTFVLFHSGSL
jgi:prepilin peptidase CpaA